MSSQAIDWYLTRSKRQYIPISREIDYINDKTEFLFDSHLDGIRRIECYLVETLSDDVVSYYKIYENKFYIGNILLKKGVFAIS